MATLTAGQIATLRRRIGDRECHAFTDGELQAAYDDAGTLDGATVVLLEWLLADASKLHDYTAAQTRVSKGQVPVNVRALLDYWRGKVQRPQVRLVGTCRPTRWKDAPD